MGEGEEASPNPCSGGKEQGRWGTNTPTPLLPSDPLSVVAPGHCGSPGMQSEEGSTPVPAGAEPGGEGQGREWVRGPVTGLVACTCVLCPLHQLDKYPVATWCRVLREMHGAGELGTHPARTCGLLVYVPLSWCPLQGSRRPAGTVTIVVLLTCLHYPASFICGCQEILGVFLFVCRVPDEPLPRSVRPVTQPQAQPQGSLSPQSACWGSPLQGGQVPFFSPSRHDSSFHIGGGPICRSHMFRGPLPAGAVGNSSWSPPGGACLNLRTSNVEIVPSYFSLVCVFPAPLAYLQGRGAPSAPAAWSDSDLEKAFPTWS